MRTHRIGTGLLIWAALGLGAWWVTTGPLVPDGDLETSIAPTLWRYATAPRQRLDLRMAEPLRIEVGDPIFVVRSGNTEQIGEIRRVFHPSGNPVRRAATERAEAVLYPGHHASGDVRLAYHKVPRSMAWAIRTLLPPEKRRRIAAMLSAAIEKHHGAIAAALRPVIRRSVRDAFAVVEEDLPAAVRRHRERLERLGSKYQRLVVEKKLVPLSKEEIWPIVRRRAAPVARDIGRQLWERVSVWSFTWRAAYDRTPLPDWAPGPDKPTVPKAFERFLEREAVPVLREHTDDFARVVRQVIDDLRANDAVVSTAEEALARILNDPAFHEVIRGIVRDVVVENPRFHEAMERHWTSPKAKEAFRIAADRLEPTVRAIGELLLGSPEKGIRPEFARVLRNQMLRKGRRWLVLERPAAPASPPSNDPPTETTVHVVRGSAHRADPFLRGKLRSNHGSP